MTSDGRSAHNPAHVRIEPETTGKGGRDLEVQIALTLGNDRLHLHILVSDFAHGIDEFWRIRYHIIGVEIEGHHLPSTGVGVARSQIRELELVVGDVVLEVDALLLTRRQVDKSRDILQKDPRSRIATVQGKASGRLLELGIEVLDLDRAHPFPTVVAEGENDLVAGAGRVVRV